MTRKNYEGLEGSASLKDSAGNPTSTTITAFWHVHSFTYFPYEEKVKINLKAWESKAEYRNEDADITNQFSDNGIVSYDVTDAFKVRKGRDRFDGDDSTTDFAFTINALGEDYIYVEVDGVKKSLGNDYTITFDSGDSGTGTISFTVAPATGSNNVVVQRQNKGWRNYFRKNSLTPLDEWPLKAISDFLQDLDGEDETDPNKIDFKSLTRDSVE